MEITIFTLTIVLAAGTATAVFDLDKLAQYDRVDVALNNTGANDVTAAAWREGAGANLDVATTRSSAVVSALVAGDGYITTLTGNDLASRVTLSLTSASGTTVTATVKGRVKGAALFPVR